MKVSVVASHPFSACLCASVCLQSFRLWSFRSFLCLRSKNSLCLSELSTRKCQFPHIYRTVASPYNITAASLTLCTVTASFSTLCAFLVCCIAFSRSLPSPRYHPVAGARSSVAVVVCPVAVLMYTMLGEIYSSTGVIHSVAGVLRLVAGIVYLGDLRGFWLFPLVRAWAVSMGFSYIFNMHCICMAV